MTNKIKAIGLTILLATAAGAQGPGYPTYVRKPKPSPTPEQEISQPAPSSSRPSSTVQINRKSYQTQSPISRPAPHADSPSTVLPKGTLYQTQGGQIREVTGPGQSINAGTSGGRSTYSRTPGNGPPTVNAGSKITTSKIERSALPGSGNYPGQQP